MSPFLLCLRKTSSSSSDALLFAVTAKISSAESDTGGDAAAAGEGVGDLPMVSFLLLGSRSQVVEHLRWGSISGCRHVHLIKQDVVVVGACALAIYWESTHMPNDL